MMQKYHIAVLSLLLFLLLGAASPSFGYGAYGRGSDLPRHPFGKAYSEVPVYRGSSSSWGAAGYGGSYGYAAPSSNFPVYRERGGATVCPPSSFYSVPEPTYYEHGEPISLFNGVDLTGWTDAEGKAPNPGWQVRDGAICRAENGAGSLFTEGKYDNFILEFDFKAARGANSGLKYRLVEDESIGCEYQILDPEGMDHGDLHDTAALYDVIPAVGVRGIFKQEEYNHAKIVVMGNYIEHWLNGKRIVSVQIGSPEWNEGLARSKFAGTRFGRNRLSRIFLQDHGDAVWFKNLTLTPLKPLY